LRQFRLYATFSAGEQPVYLQIAWLTKSDPSFIYLARHIAVTNRREELAGLTLITIEQREYKAITYELQLYGRPGAYKAEPIVEWPEEIDVGEVVFDEEDYTNGKS
jgi:hypothetical protein